MDTVIIEGTIEEVTRELKALAVPSKSRIRVAVSDAPTDSPAHPFSAAARRNGLILLPTREPHTPITTELVKDLMDQE